MKNERLLRMCLPQGVKLPEIGSAPDFGKMLPRMEDCCCRLRNIPICVRDSRRRCTKFDRHSAVLPE